MKKEKRERYFPCEIRAVQNDEGKSIIEGVPVVFEEHTLIWDYFDEVIKRGALDKTDLKDVCLLVNHDSNRIALARTKNGKGTMSLSIQDDGLHFRAELDTENNADARALYSAVKRGDMDGMSFAFSIADGGATWTDVENAKEPPYAYREVTDIAQIYEVSVVNWPAYEATSVATRSREEKEISEHLKEIKEKEQRRKSLESQALELERLKNINRSKI